MKTNFNIGDLVYDTNNKCYGLVLNNYGNATDGDGGEIRLDSDGNQCIFSYTKRLKRNDYNLIKQDLSKPEIQKIRKEHIDTLSKFKENYINQPELYNLFYK